MDGDFLKENDVLVRTCMLQERGKALHLMGLLARAAYTATSTTCSVCLDLAKQHGREERLCPLLHGRPRHRRTPARATLRSSGEAWMKEIGVGKIATVTGRYYAMDRDNWDRVGEGL